MIIDLDEVEIKKIQNIISETEGRVASLSWGEI